MKSKIITVLLLASVIFGSVPVTLSASGLPLRIVVDSHKVNFSDAQPFTDDNGVVQLPLSFIMDDLKVKTVWTENTGVLSLTVDKSTLVAKINDRSYLVNGKAVTTTSSLTQRDGVLYVPANWLSEGLKMEEYYDAAVNTIYIRVTTSEKALLKEDPKTVDDGTIKTVVVAGFIITYSRMGHNLDPVYIKKSELMVFDGEWKPGSKNMIVQFTVSYNQVGAQPAVGMKELEALLRQKVKPKTVDAIMKVARKKMKREDKIPSSVFTDGKYRLYLSSRSMEDLSVGIFPLK